MSFLQDRWYFLISIVTAVSGSMAFWENQSFLSKMAENLGIVKNGSPWLTLGSFCAEYTTFIQRLLNFYTMCKSDWSLAYFHKIAEILVFPRNEFIRMIMSSFCT